MPNEDGVYFYSSGVQLLTFLCISYLAENEKTYSGGESYAKNLNPVEIFHPRAQHWFEIFWCWSRAANNYVSVHGSAPAYSIRSRRIVSLRV